MVKNTVAKEFTYCTGLGSAGSCAPSDPRGQNTNLRILRSPTRSSALAALVSVPWCCILPAALSLLSLTGAVVTRVWVAKLTWIFLSVGAVLLGRAFWLLYVKHQGGPWSRRLAWVSSLLILTLWAPRLWAWFSW